MSWYILYNHNTKKYLKVEQKGLPDDWHDHYPHLHGCDFPECFSVWDHDMTPNGMFYVYDLCVDGMLATLLVDIEEYSKEDIKESEAWMRNAHDIVRLRIAKMAKADPPKDKPVPVPAVIDPNLVTVGTDLSDLLSQVLRPYLGSFANEELKAHIDHVLDSSLIANGITGLHADVQIKGSAVNPVLRVGPRHQ